MVSTIFTFKLFLDLQLDVILSAMFVLMRDHWTGNSTQADVIAEIYQADFGEMSVSGRAARNLSPSAARRSGVSREFKDVTPTGRIDLISLIFMRRKVFRYKRIDLSVSMAQQVMPAKVIGELKYQYVLSSANTLGGPLSMGQWQTTPKVVSSEHMVGLRGWLVAVASVRQNLATRAKGLDATVEGPV